MLVWNISGHVSLGHLSKCLFLSNDLEIRRERKKRPESGGKRYKHREKKRAYWTELTNEVRCWRFCEHCSCDLSNLEMVMQNHAKHKYSPTSCPDAHSRTQACTHVHIYEQSHSRHFRATTHTKAGNKIFSLLRW